MGCCERRLRVECLTEESTGGWPPWEGDLLTMLLDRQCCIGLLCPAAGGPCWHKESKHAAEVGEALTGRWGAGEVFLRFAWVPAESPRCCAALRCACPGRCLQRRVTVAGMPEQCH